MKREKEELCYSVSTKPDWAGRLRQSALRTQRQKPHPFM